MFYHNFIYLPPIFNSLKKKMGIFLHLALINPSKCKKNDFFIKMFIILIISFILTIISVYIENNEVSSYFPSQDTEKRSSYMLPRHFEQINSLNLSKNKEKIYVLFIRFIHYAFTIFICFYIFIFNDKLTFSPERSVGENKFCENEVEAKYDIYYIILFCLLLLHWIFLDECYLSKVENDYYKKTKFTFLQERSAGENEFCGNEVKAKLRYFSKRSVEENPFTVVCEGKREIPQSTNHPYLKIFFKENTDWFILFQGIMMAINIFYIICGRIFLKNFKGFFILLHKLPQMKYRIIITIVLIGTMSFLMIKDRI